jgi:hypothetical protein
MEDLSSYLTDYSWLSGAYSEKEKAKRGVAPP